MKSEPKKQTPPKASKLEAAVHSAPKDDLLIAAVGASAGGIEAFTELMINLPADSGMAFVLVQHLDPKHRSLLTELLSKKTAMRVTEVTDGMKVERDHVCVPLIFLLRIRHGAEKWIAPRRLPKRSAGF